MNVIVMGGLGEVGAALHDVIFDSGCANVYILEKDKAFSPPEDIKYDFLHVAIPYSDAFLDDVKKAASLYHPNYIVVHSTVPIGTTRRIGSLAAHSPVRGNHPGLRESLLSFVKYIGAHNHRTRAACFRHMKKVGMKVESWEKPEDTEIMKLLCLSRYLNDLAFYETAFGVCRKYKVNPIKMIRWTGTYNDGYKGTKYKRADLTFPMGKIGGHCVMPMSRILADQTGDIFFRKNLEVFDGI